MNKTTKIIYKVLFSILVLIGILWIFLNFDSDQIKTDISGLEPVSSSEIKEQNSPKIKSENKNMIIKNGQFYLPDGRTLFLRGINLGGSTKVPFTPNIGSHVNKNFFNGVNVSFVGRPFPLKDADEHFSRLQAWGFNFIRFLVTWEAIEHDGPGVYDEAYLEYVRAIIQKAGEYNINVFIDPHQDLWSRFSGGDGAPLWTFEVAGMDVKNFKATDAAFVHNTHGDPYPKMVWFSNYFKLATTTMFTLFFAGNDFAPNVKVNDTIPIQDYLQSHYINAMVQVAKKLKDLPNVVGFELMNEPSSGYVGIEDLSKPFETSVLGLSPTPWQGMLLGDGIPQKVKKYELGIASLKDMGEELINEEKKSAWLNPAGDIWKQEGVWAMGSDNNPKLLKPDYFTKVEDRKVDFNEDYYLPFTEKYEKAIHEIDSDWFICVDNVLFPLPHQLPDLKSLGDKNWVNGSHWYDDATLVTKKYIPWVGLLDDEIIIGKRNVRIAFEQFIGNMFWETKTHFGSDAATILGEFGIPFDMNEGKAYKNGNFSQQIKAMDRSIKLLEKNKMSYTLWNYTADNTNERGDQWNGEDLSVFSYDQQRNPKDINSGGRALQAVIRPFPVKIAGFLEEYAFDMEKGELIIKYLPDLDISDPTEIFLPDYHYKNGFEVFLSDGNLGYDKESNILMVTPNNNEVVQVIIVKKKLK